MQKALLMLLLLLSSLVGKAAAAASGNANTLPATPDCSLRHVNFTAPCVMSTSLLPVL